MNTNANNKNGFTKIRCTDMVPGAVYALALYNAKDIILAGTCVSRPNVPVLAMGKDDRYVMEVNGERLEFFRNASPPHYLETRIKTPRGSFKNTRVVFYEIDEITKKSVDKIVNGENKKFYAPVLIEKAKNTKRRGQPVKTPEVIYMTFDSSNHNTKPVRADNESFGKWMARLNAWKKMQHPIAA